ncbi:MAG: hypothetical protein RLY86_3719 [Pseudomonadota bacterium]|jgi:hypothetical protein
MTALNLHSPGRTGGRPGNRAGDWAGTPWRGTVTGTVLGMLATLAAGPVIGGIAFAATMAFTAMAPMMAVIAGAAAQFAVAHLVVHRYGVEPIGFLRGYFVLLWALLFLGTLAVVLGSAGDGGTMMVIGLLAGPPLLAGLLTFIPALAAGDKAPPLF